MRYLLLLILLSSSLFSQEAAEHEKIATEEVALNTAEAQPDEKGVDFLKPQETEEPSDEEEEGIDFFSMVPSMPSEIEVISNGGSEYDAETKTLTFTEDVVVKGDNGLIIYADKAIIESENERVTTQGNVSVFSGPLLYNGDEAIYYYKTKKIDTKGLRTSNDPFLMEADTLKTVEKNGRMIQVAENAKVTTDDYANPSYWFKADKIAIHPNDTVIFKGMKIQVGGRTIFWLPYFYHSIDSDLGYHFTPGATTYHGFFLRNRYGMHLGGERDPQTLEVKDPSHLLKIHADYYSRRGIGLGADFYDLNYKAHSELGNYSFYWINDMDPKVERTRTSRADFNEKNRYKIEVKDRRNFGELWGGDTRLDTNLTYLSDSFFLEDFFERQFSTNPAPDNQISLSHVRERSVTNLATRFQLNPFYETDSRLPEVTLDYTRSRLWDSPILYENQTSFGYLKRILSDEQKEEFTADLSDASDLTEINELQTALSENGYFRTHTWHEISSPFKPFDGFTVTPRAGIGYTHYTDDDNTVNSGQWISHLGVDLALKFSKNYPQFNFERIGLKGLGHRVQPYVNFSYLDVSGVDLSSVSPVDTLTPITRPRPVNVGRSSAIDALEDWFIIRTGLRQTFLTKRNGGSHEWLYLDTYLDFLPSETDTANSFSNLYNELVWNPLPWITFNLETQFPLRESANDFTEIHLDTTFMIGKSSHFTIGFQFLENHPIVRDITQLNYRLYHRVNDQWGLGMYHNWRLDRDLLSLQSYSIHRNLKSWVFSAELFQRDFIVDQEWGINFGLALRDFPDISLPISIQRQ